MSIITDTRNTELRAASLLFDLAEMAEFWSTNDIFSRRYPLPGQYLARLSEDKRELLRHLKSDDVRRARWPR